MLPLAPFRYVAFVLAVIISLPIAGETPSVLPNPDSVVELSDDSSASGESLRDSDLEEPEESQQEVLPTEEDDEVPTTQVNEEVASEEENFSQEPDTDANPSTGPPVEDRADDGDNGDGTDIDGSHLQEPEESQQEVSLTEDDDDASASQVAEEVASEKDSFQEPDTDANPSTNPPVEDGADDEDNGDDADIDTTVEEPSVEEDDPLSDSESTTIATSTSDGEQDVGALADLVDITLIVTDWDTDEPLAGATIILEDADGVQVASGMTSASGQLVVNDLESGFYYYAEVSSDGYHPRRYEFNTNHGPTIVIALSAAEQGALTVTVVDYETLATIPNATVKVYHTDSEQLVEQGSTNGAGVFETSVSLESAWYHLSVSADGFHDRHQYAVFVNGSTDAEVALNPAVPGVLTVIVTEYDTSAPVPNATVTVFSGDTFQEVAQGTTDNEGRWMSPQLPSGLYYVNTIAPGYHSRENFEHRLSGDATLDITINRKVDVVLTLTALDQGSSAPVVNADVTLRYYESGEVAASGTTDQNGQIVTPPIPQGSYTVDIVATGYVNPSFVIVLEATQEFTEYLVKGQTDPTETPTVPPTVPPTETPTVPPTETPTVPPTEVPTVPPTEAPTDSPTVPPTDAPTVPPTGTPTEIPTENPVGNTLTVVVELANGESIEGAPYSLYAPTASLILEQPYAQGFVGANNTIQITDVIAGQYRLVIEPVGMEPISVTLMVGSDPTTSVRIVVEADGQVTVNNDSAPEPTSPTELTEPSLPTEPTGQTDPTSSDDTGDADTSVTGLPATGVKADRSHLFVGPMMLLIVASLFCSAVIRRSRR